MTHPRQFVVAVAALAIGLSGGLARAETDAPDIKGMAVSVVNARRACFRERMVASGTFVARHETEVRADRDGLLVGEVLVGAGDVVAADQIMSRLVPPPGSPQDGVTVKAPIRGMVVAIAAPVGSYASPSARDPMFRIVSDEGLELRADILASRLPHLKPGMAAKVHIVGLGDRDGQVTAIAPAIDATTQTAAVSLSVAEPRLRIGAFARAEIEGSEDCGILVPLSALLSGQDGSVVVGVVRDEKVEMRKVGIGLLEAGNAEVRSGLRENDQVIARAGAFLREGDLVRAMPVPEHR